MNVNNHEEILQFSPSNRLFVNANGPEISYDSLAFKQEKKNDPFTYLFPPSSAAFSPFIPLLASSPSSPALPHGLGELLAVWMLALYCEHSLIDSLLPTASQASQHGVPGCLATLSGQHAQGDKKKRKKSNGDSDWTEEPRRRASIKRLSKFPEASSRIICFSLPLCRSVPRSSHSQRRSMAYSTSLHLSCFKIVLLCLFSAGDDPFTDSPFSRLS